MTDKEYAEFRKEPHKQHHMLQILWRALRLMKKSKITAKNQNFQRYKDAEFLKHFDGENLQIAKYMTGRKTTKAGIKAGKKFVKQMKDAFKKLEDCKKQNTSNGSGGGGVPGAYSRYNEDAEAMRHEALKQWASERPTTNRGWDDPPLSEDAQAMHDYDVEKWARRMPDLPTGYEDERR